jgi:hypothetical protein
LPSHRIQRAHELSEIDLEEHPTPTCLRSRNQAALGACADLRRMHVEERRRIVEIQGAYSTRSREKLYRR